MKSNYYILTAIVLFLGGFGTAQRPPQGPPGAPPRDGQIGPGAQGPNRPPRDDWFKRLDTNEDGKVDSAELQAAIDASFTAWDKNANGMLDAGEMPRPPRPPRPPNGWRDVPGEQGMRPDGPPREQGDKPPAPGEMIRNMLPPFFFADRNPEGAATSRSDFERIVHGVFTELDRNGDGVISREEARPPMRPGQPEGPPQGAPPPPPNARFIGAELRFGDKLVTGQPFSAEIVIEDTRRLYDGTSVTKQNHGAIYRDGAGRTRREQPLEMVGGVNIVGTDNKPQTLVFINDVAAKSQTFLDLNNKVARKNRMGGQPPPPEPNEPPDAKTESLGTKTIDGIKVEGTRVTFEIPSGQLGNDKPIQVVSERWFSLELQVLMMSRHLDPLAGEHVFKLTNIKRAEPSADLFAIPSGFRIENAPEKRPEE